MVAESKVRIRGDSRDAERAIDRVKSGLTGLSATARALPGFTALGAAVAGAFSAQAILGITRAAKEIDNLSQVANASSVEFQRYASGVDSVGLSSEKFADILKDVNDKLGDFLETGGGGMADFFENIAPAIGVTADQFANLSGPQALQLYYNSLEKANVSAERMTFYLEAIASDSSALVPLLRNNGELFKQFGDEAERAGTIIGEDLSEASRQFERNIARIQKSIDGIKISVGNSTIPAMAEVSEEFLAMQRAGLGFWETLALRTSLVSTDYGEQLAALKQQLGELQLARSKALENEGPYYAAQYDDEIEFVKKAIAAYTDLTESKRKLAEEDTEQARKLAYLEGELAKARGKYIKDAATAAKTANKEQIKDAENLKSALEKAWQASVDGARAASQEAAGLLKQAAQSQADFQRQANARREQDLSPEQQQRAILDRAQQAADEASYRAAAAEVEAIDGRAQSARDYAEQAKKLIEEAADAANQVEDNETAAALLERLGEASAAAIRTEARLKEAEAQSLDDTAKAQQAQINTLVDQLAKLKAESADVPVVVDTDAAKARVEELQKAIADLKAAAASVPIGSGATGDFSNTGGATGSFAAGGFTGWGGKYQPAGIVHRGEYVFDQASVRRLGLDYLESLRRRGVRGYASGGLVAGVRVPSVRAQSAPALRPVTLDLGAYGRYDMQAGDGQIEGIERALRRERLKRGGR